MSVRINSKREVLAFITEEAKRQHFTIRGLSLKAGYSISYLTNMRRENAISLTSAIDFLQVLGYSFVIDAREVPKEVLTNSRR